MSITEDALDLVRAERHRQDKKWGIQRHGLPVWLTVLTEEVGEVAQAVLKLRGTSELDEREECVDNLLLELTQTAAVAVAALEHAMEEAYSHGVPFEDEVASAVY